MDIRIYQKYDAADGMFYDSVQWNLCGIDHCSVFIQWSWSDGYIYLERILLYFDHLHIDGDFDEGRIRRRVANVSRGCIDENGCDFGDTAAFYK